MKGMGVSLGTDVKGDERIRFSASSRLAASDEVGTRSPNGILDNVGEEGRQDQGDGKAEDGIMVFMKGGACNAIIHDHEDQRDTGSVDDVQPDRNPLNLGMRKSNVEIVDVKHAMKRFDEEDKDQIGRKEGTKTQVVRGI